MLSFPYNQLMDRLRQLYRETQSQNSQNLKNVLLEKAKSMNYYIIKEEQNMDKRNDFINFDELVFYKNKADKLANTLKQAKIFNYKQQKIQSKVKQILQQNYIKKNHYEPLKESNSSVIKEKKQDKSKENCENRKSQIYQVQQQMKRLTLSNNKDQIRKLKERLNTQQNQCSLKQDYSSQLSNSKKQIVRLYQSHHHNSINYQINQEEEVQNQPNDDEMQQVLVNTIKLNQLKPKNKNSDYCLADTVKQNSIDKQNRNQNLNKQKQISRDSLEKYYEQEQQQELQQIQFKSKLAFFKSEMNIFRGKTISIKFKRHSQSNIHKQIISTYVQNKTNQPIQNISIYYYNSHNDYQINVIKKLQTIQPNSLNKQVVQIKLLSSGEISAIIAQLSVNETKILFIVPAMFIQFSKDKLIPIQYNNAKLKISTYPKFQTMEKAAEFISFDKEKGNDYTPDTGLIYARSKYNQGHIRYQWFQKGNVVVKTLKQWINFISFLFQLRQN